MTDIFNDNSNTKQELVINLTNFSKSTLVGIASNIVQSVHDNEADAMSEYLKAKAVSEIAEAVMSGIKEDVKDEVEKYGKECVFSGTSFVIKNQADSYDFSHDEEWVLLNQQMDALKTKIKAREKKMVDAIKYSNLVDENGEIIPPAVVKKRGGTILSLTLPK